MKNINVNKSIGPDECHSIILYEASEQLCDPLSIILNKSFESGEVPLIWKITSVYYSEIKGGKSDPSNYKPASLTFAPCKLCEKSVRSVIMSHMSTSNSFSDSQFGFRNKSSTFYNCWTFYMILLNILTTVFKQIPFVWSSKKLLIKFSHRRCYWN